eukprot:6191291-Pleurochrysis_carterae.AAC.2
MRPAADRNLRAQLLHFPFLGLWRQVKGRSHLQLFTGDLSRMRFAVRRARLVAPRWTSLHFSPSWPRPDLLLCPLTQISRVRLIVFRTCKLRDVDPCEQDGAWWLQGCPEVPARGGAALLPIVLSMEQISSLVQYDAGHCPQ